MKIEDVDNILEPLGWERDLCHDGKCYPELNEHLEGHEGSYKKFNMTEHGEDGYISYQSANEIIESVQPRLTIPREMAEILDTGYEECSEWHNDVSWVIGNMDFLPNDDYVKFYVWLKSNQNLALVYLASKALGVELVEVGE